MRREINEERGQGEGRLIREGVREGNNGERGE